LLRIASSFPAILLVQVEEIMALREIIVIDDDKCNGCGECETGCPEGALRIIDGKARLVGESLCDGLGACIGNCPYGAITVIRREAEAYDERKVMEGIVKHGPGLIRAHIDHLRHHGQDSYVAQALAFLAEKGIAQPETLAVAASPAAAPVQFSGCPGSRQRSFAPAATRPDSKIPQQAEKTPSALAQWPIQLHLINPRASHFAGSRLLIAADCTAFALGSFHSNLLAGRSLVIACPKLDQGKDIYLDKLAVLLETAASVEVAIMEVPCCSGLLKMLLDARERGTKRLPIETIVVGIEGGLAGRAVH
jgi:ferredoxin